MPFLFLSLLFVQVKTKKLAHVSASILHLAMCFEIAGIEMAESCLTR